MADFLSEEHLRPIETSGGERLFRDTLERYQRRLSSSLDKGFDQFGLTLFHSLPISQKVNLREQFGWTDSDDKRSIYNKGCLAASNERWDEAIGHFRQALEKDPDFREALFNLAVTTEKKGDIAGARPLYEKYMSIVDADPYLAEEAARVRQHLEELGG